MESKRKIIVAVTGASGAIYAESLLERIGNLEEGPGEVALVFTKIASEIWEYELGERFNLKDKRQKYKDKSKAKSKVLFKVYDNRDFYAPFASGSSRYDTMIICPTSMGMLGRIANGVADDLVSRAADVMLKERRKLILVPRETPYNLIHINNMKLLTEAGAIILPATPSFYSKPDTVKDLVLTVVDRILDIAGFDVGGYKWGG
ncbi:MAG: UbiX family flavin prenyltransferase [Bacteroidota bacterium]|nr:UbiX family flavin prenyltransferase [Bacteroidota bacterium]